MAGVPDSAALANSVCQRGNMLYLAASTFLETSATDAHRNGSCGKALMVLWLRKKGVKALRAVQRLHSSSSVLPAYPQVSEPTIGIPNLKKGKISKTVSNHDRLDGGTNWNCRTPWMECQRWRQVDVVSLSKPFVSIQAIQQSFISIISPNPLCDEEVISELLS